MARLPRSIIKKYGISKKAWRVFRGRRRRRNPTRRIRKTVRRVRRRMARRRKRSRRSAFSVSTAFKFMRLGALLAPGVAESTQYDQIGDKIAGGIGIYGGWNHGSKQFEWGKVAQAWTPYVVATLVTKGIQKLSGIIGRF